MKRGSRGCQRRLEWTRQQDARKRGRGRGGVAIRPPETSLAAPNSYETMTAVGWIWYLRWNRHTFVSNEEGARLGSSWDSDVLIVNAIVVFFQTWRMGLFSYFMHVRWLTMSVKSPKTDLRGFFETFLSIVLNIAVKSERGLVSFFLWWHADTVKITSEVSLMQPEQKENVPYLGQWGIRTFGWNRLKQ